MEKEIELIEIKANSIDEFKQELDKIINMEYTKITIHAAVILSKNLLKV